MVLKIERDFDGQKLTFRLSGRMKSEHVEELRELIDASRTTTVLDLREVTLVDSDVVRFLGACEANGIQLSHCSPYIREWIIRERYNQGKTGGVQP